MEQESLSVNIDFDKISSQLDEVIKKANQEVLKELPNASLSEIEYIATISKAVCLTMLQDYHNELMNAVNKVFRTKAEQVHPEQGAEHFH